MINLEMIAKYHDSQAEYEEMSAKQSWGRTKSFIEMFQKRATMHRQFAKHLRKIANRINQDRP